MHPLVNTATKAARRASGIILRNADRLDRVSVQQKGRNDFVSDVDRQAEAAIIDVIRSAYPDHALLAEESGRHEGAEFEWVIDPLDGTTNFLHGYPHYGVSIAVRRRGTVEHAVVMDPLRNEIFSATRGAGARLNDRRIRVSAAPRLDGTLIGTGFPFREMGHLDVYLASLRLVLTRAGSVRRAGAAALDLAHVAAGRLDGFWELGLSPWDVAAGALLIEEAGGIVTDLSGGRTHLDRGHVLAGSPTVHERLRELLRPVIPADLCG